MTYLRKLGGGGSSGSGTPALTPVAMKTAAYTANAGEFVPCDTTAGGFTVTLPTTPADGTCIAVRHVTRGGGSLITVHCGGSDVLDKTAGSVSKDLTLAGTTLCVQYHASDGVWEVLYGALDLAQLDTRYAPLSGGNTVSTTSFGVIAPDTTALRGLSGELRHLPGGSATVPSLSAYSTGRSIQSRDIVFAYTAYGTGSQPFDNSTQYANATYNPIVFINRSFVRMGDIASVAWYLDDTALAGGSTTPGTTAIANSGGAAPFSVGGPAATGTLEMSQWDLTTLGSFGVAHTLSALVTYDSGVVETATATFYPYNSAASITLPGTGATSLLGRGVYTGPTDTTTRAARAVLDAGASNAVIVGGSSWRGSNLTVRGQVRHIGKLETRGNNYHFEGSGSAQGFEITFPPIIAYATTDGTETAARCLVNSFQGTGYAQSNTYRDLWVHDGISDLLYTERCKDLLLDRCRFEHTSDLAGPAHYDGWQMAGDVKATGALTDYKGNSVAILVRNCEWNHASWIIKSDLGTCDAITVENSIVHDSNREGILVQDVNAMGNVTFRNVWTWGHLVADYSYQGSTVTVVADNFNYSQSHIGGVYAGQGTTPSQPAGWVDIGRPIIVGDQSKASGTGASISLSRPSTSNVGCTVLAFVAIDDPTKTVTAPAQFSQFYDSGSGSTGPRVYGFSYYLGSGYSAGPYVFTASASVNYVAWAESMTGAKSVSPVESCGATGTAAATTFPTPSARITNKNRMIQHLYFVSGATAAGTWTRPTSWAGQVNTTTTAQATTTMSSYVLFQPWSLETPAATHGGLGATYSQSGNATALSVVIAPQYEAPPDRVIIPGVQAADVPGRFSGLVSRNVEDAIVETNKKITTGVTASSTTPLADNITPAVGSSSTFARADHVHPLAGNGIYVPSAQVQVTNTTTETVVMGPYTIPANSVVAGSTYRVKVWGTVNEKGTSPGPAGNLTIRLRIGGTAGTSFNSFGMTTTSSTDVTGKSLYAEFNVIFRGAASSTTSTVCGGFYRQEITSTQGSMFSGPTNVNMTTAKDLVLTATWGTADVGNTVNIEGGSIELVK